ncbi:MAG: hypothetical protein ACU85U_10410 [Gammaproteobacteria bacterium]|jgi:hypothetical protein
MLGTVRDVTRQHEADEYSAADVAQRCLEAACEPAHPSFADRVIVRRHDSQAPVIRNATRHARALAIDVPSM